MSCWDEIGNPRYWCISMSCYEFCGTGKLYDEYRVMAYAVVEAVKKKEEDGHFISSFIHSMIANFLWVIMYSTIYSKRK